MNIYSLTNKASIEKKVFDGVEYWLCDRNDDIELWIKAPDDKESECVRCGYKGAALESHHVYGRKNSDVTILLCANCHKEKHAGIW
jgi:Zn ribbon nucleic-acid-binding protein